MRETRPVTRRLSRRDTLREIATSSSESESEMTLVAELEDSSSRGFSLA